MQHAVDVTKEQQISIRLEPDVAERAEALVARMASRVEFKPFRLTRASVLRMAMLEGLGTLEERYGSAGDDANDTDGAARRAPTKRKPKR